MLLKYYVDKGVLKHLWRNAYAFAKDLNRFVIANGLHGPSYLSYETALSIYSLIPERVNDVLSVTTTKKEYKTPCGRFIFRGQNSHLFALGMSRIEHYNEKILIATKEKALLDTLASARLNCSKATNQEIFEYVTDGLRIDSSELFKLKITHVKTMSKLYRNRAPIMFFEQLSQLIKRARKP